MCLGSPALLCQWGHTRACTMGMRMNVQVPLGITLVCTVRGVAVRAHLCVSASVKCVCVCAGLCAREYTGLHCLDVCVCGGVPDLGCVYLSWPGCLPAGVLVCVLTVGVWVLVGVAAGGSTFLS